MVGGVENIQKNIAEDITEKIDAFLDLNSEELKKAIEMGNKIIKKARKMEKILFEKEKKKRYEKIFSRLNLKHSKLVKDVSRKKKAFLKPEWKKLSKQDMSNLEDELIALREFINEEKTLLRKRWNKKQWGMDLKDLNRLLDKEKSVSASTKAEFSKKIRKMESERIQSSTKDNSERLDRINKWLVLLREVRRIE